MPCLSLWRHCTAFPPPSSAALFSGKITKAPASRQRPTICSPRRARAPLILYDHERAAVSRSLKILLVVEAYNSIGGVIEVVDHLATELAAAGHRVAIASTRAEGELRPAPPAVECTYLAIRGRKPVTWRHLERLLREPLLLRTGELAQLVRRWAPDLVSNHT